MSPAAGEALGAAAVAVAAAASAGAEGSAEAGAEAPRALGTLKRAAIRIKRRWAALGVAGGSLRIITQTPRYRDVRLCPVGMKLA